jgi:hypothetical protein
VLCSKCHRQIPQLRRNKTKIPLDHNCLPGIMLPSHSVAGKSMASCRIATFAAPLRLQAIAEDITLLSTDSPVAQYPGPIRIP